MYESVRVPPAGITWSSYPWRTVAVVHGGFTEVQTTTTASYTSVAPATIVNVRVSPGTYAYGSRTSPGWEYSPGVTLRLLNGARALGRATIRPPITVNVAKTKASVRANEVTLEVVIAASSLLSREGGSTAGRHSWVYINRLGCLLNPMEGMPVRRRPARAARAGDP